MGSHELTQWMAFSALENEDYKQKIEAEVKKESDKQKTEEELGSEIKAMLMGLKGNG